MEKKIQKKNTKREVHKMKKPKEEPKEKKKKKNSWVQKKTKIKVRKKGGGKNLTNPCARCTWVFTFQSFSWLGVFSPIVSLFQRKNILMGQR